MFLDWNFVTATIVTFVVAVGAWSALRVGEWLRRVDPTGEKLSVIQRFVSGAGGDYLAALAMVWVLATLFIGWNHQLEREFTYRVRSGRSGAAAVIALVIAGLWVFPVYLPGLPVRELQQGRSDRTTLALGVATSVILALMLIGQTRRAYRDFRYEAVVGEAISRLGFVIGAGVWFWWSLNS